MTPIRFGNMVARAAVLGAVLLMGVFATSCSTRPPANYARVERTMTVTAYCACQECCGWQRNWYGKPVYGSGALAGQRKKVGQTASGVQAKQGRTIAASPAYTFGTYMDVPGYGLGRVEDRGSAIQGNHIDVYFRSHRVALKWGRKTLPVTVWRPPNASRAAKP